MEHGVYNKESTVAVKVDARRPRHTVIQALGMDWIDGVYQNGSTIYTSLRVFSRATYFSVIRAFSKGLQFHTIYPGMCASTSMCRPSITEVHKLCYYYEWGYRLWGVGSTTWIEICPHELLIVFTVMFVHCMICLAFPLQTLEFHTMSLWELAQLLEKENQCQ